MKPVQLTKAAGTTAIAAITLLFLLSGESCKKKKADEGELITKVTVITDDGTKFDTMVWSDPDGAGGNNPLPADTIVLDSGKFVNVWIYFANGDGDITDEIKTAGAEHIVCMENGGRVQGQRKDDDGKLPLGLEWVWQAAVKGKGTVNIILKHQPGEKDGTCNPGETDVSVIFPLQVN